MSTRPTSITVVSWIIIVTVLTSLVVSTLNFDNPMTKDLMSRSAIPIPLQYIKMYFGLLAQLVSGIAILKCKNWGRLLFTIWTVIRLAIELATSPITTMVIVIPEVVFDAVIVFILFRPKAREYFKNCVARPEASLRMRNIFSIVFLVIAGFFVNIVCIIAFIPMGSEVMAILVKFVMIVVFPVPVLALSLLIGVKLNKTRAWKKSVGLVFMWGAISTFYQILTFVCMLASPDIRKEKR